MPTGIITFGDIKSAQYKISNAETMVLRNVMRNEVLPNTETFVVDSVISGFFLRISEMSTNEVICITVQEAAYIFQGHETSLLFSAEYLEESDYYNWAGIRKILIPVNVNQNHWILIVLCPSTKLIQGKFDKLTKYN